MINVPVPMLPTSEIGWFWFFIGFLFARAFGKQLDYNVQQTAWYKRRHIFWQQFLKRTMDFLHHFWIGWFLTLYFTQPEICAFGAGIFYDDIPDFKRYLKMIQKMIDYLKTG